MRLNIEPYSSHCEAEYKTLFKPSPGWIQKLTQATRRLNIKPYSSHHQAEYRTLFKPSWGLIQNLIQAIISPNVESFSSHHETEYRTFNKVLYLSIAETCSCFYMCGISCVQTVILLSFFLYVCYDVTFWLSLHRSSTTVQYRSVGSICNFNISRNNCTVNAVSWHTHDTSGVTHLKNPPRWIKQGSESNSPRLS